jgi:hypothetical protein
MFSNTGEDKKPVLNFMREDLPTSEPYLFCAFSNTHDRILCIPDSKIDGGKVPSQFFRRVFAEICNPDMENPFFNWKIPSEVARSEYFRAFAVGETKGQFENNSYVMKLFNEKLDGLRKIRPIQSKNSSPIEKNRPEEILVR